MDLRLEASKMITHRSSKNAASNMFFNRGTKWDIMSSMVMSAIALCSEWTHRGKYRGNAEFPQVKSDVHSMLKRHPHRGWTEPGGSSRGRVCAGCPWYHGQFRQYPAPLFSGCSLMLDPGFANQSRQGNTPRQQVVKIWKSGPVCLSFILVVWRLQKGRTSNQDKGWWGSWNKIHPKPKDLMFIFVDPIWEDIYKTMVQDKVAKRLGCTSQKWVTPLIFQITFKHQSASPWLQQHEGARMFIYTLFRPSVCI